MLDAAGLEAYRRDGQATAPRPLPPAALQAIEIKMDALLAARPDLDPNYVPHLIEIDRSWLEIAALPEILDVVEQAIGPDIICWGSALFCKTAGDGKATPWHQDGHYWPIRPLATVTVWLAIDAATPENGCLRIVPGSHRAGELYDHDRRESDAAVLNQELDLARFDWAPPRDVVLTPGQFSIHDVYAVHGAEPNRSGKRRAGLALRYMPAASYFDRDLAARMTAELGVIDISRRQLHLLRGRDASGRNDIARPPDDV